MEIKIGVRSVHRELIVETDFTADRSRARSVPPSRPAPVSSPSPTSTAGRSSSPSPRSASSRSARRRRAPSASAARSDRSPGPRGRCRPEIGTNPAHRPRSRTNAASGVSTGARHAPSQLRSAEENRPFSQVPGHSSRSPSPQQRGRLTRRRCPAPADRRAPRASPAQHGTRSPAVRPTSRQGTAIAARGPHVSHATAVRSARVSIRGPVSLAPSPPNRPWAAAGREEHPRGVFRHLEPQGPGSEPQGGHPLAVLLGQPGEHPADVLTRGPRQQLRELRPGLGHVPPLAQRLPDQPSGPQRQPPGLPGAARAAPRRPAPRRTRERPSSARTSSTSPASRRPPGGRLAVEVERRCPCRRTP